MFCTGMLVVCMLSVELLQGLQNSKSLVLKSEKRHVKMSCG